jgi:hypothetical protein
VEPLIRFILTLCIALYVIEFPFVLHYLFFLLIAVNTLIFLIC